IAGWRVASHMRTSMVLDALEMARWPRGTTLQDSICHSDAGSQGGFNRRSQHRLDEVSVGVRRRLPRECASR
ncbi:transposase, partial [Mycolicibacterium phlei]|nr:transposase [Mycolicibacterium phlei]